LPFKKGQNPLHSYPQIFVEVKSSQVKAHTAEDPAVSPHPIKTMFVIKFGTPQM